MSNLVEEISRRRTFAIISHPDAGKTTLTEKFPHSQLAAGCRYKENLSCAGVRPTGGVRPR